MAAFVAHAANRTADVIASIPVLTAQYLAFMSLSDEQRQIQNVDPQAMEEEVKEASKDDLKKFARFATEEVLRRQIKRDAMAFGKKEILGMLFPNMKKVRTETLHARKKEIEDS